MTKRLSQKTICSLAIAVFGITAYGAAQDAPTLNCSDGNCPAAPPVAIATMGVAQVGVVTTGGMTFAVAGNSEVTKDLPYEAQAVTEIRQTLADGTHIKQSSTATVARDSDGRTVRVQKLSAIGPWKSASDTSQSDGPTLTSIFDPVARTHTDFTSDSRIAHVLTIPDPPASGALQRQSGGFAMVTARPDGGSAGPVTLSTEGHYVLSGPADAQDAKTESLGTKTIDGISVTGTRDTRTIPAGTIGNDKDLVITRETWYSPDLRLVVQSTQKDPRFGETTYSLTNIQRSDPDASLFQVPAGYKLDRVPAPTPAN
jgi:hypothetical protein